MRPLLVLLVGLVVVPSAAATFSITVSTPSPIAAPGVTLNGVDQTQTFPMAISVENTNPSSTTGWNVTAASTAPTFGSFTLPALVVTNVAAAPCSGSGCTDPTNSIGMPVTLNGTDQKIFNAAVGTGSKATFNLTATFKVSYPAGVPAGTYSATVTISGTRSP
jgi:hypothetical protein